VKQLPMPDYYSRLRKRQPVALHRAQSRRGARKRAAPCPLRIMGVPKS
jgi:hypothetical protein